jgi:hypothetical protein
MLRRTKAVNYWHFLPLALLFGLIISGCGPAATGANDLPTGQKVVGSQTVNEQPTSTTPPESPVKEAIDIETITDSQTEEEGFPEEEKIAPVKTTTSKHPMTDEEVNEVMDVLLDPNGPEKDTVDRILESGDERFVAVLLELMRARQIGLIVGSYDRIIDALEELSDQSFLDDWPAWIVWYGQSDLEPPPGFTGWKGQLLGRLDSRFADFLRDDFPSRIRTEEILWGGVSVDGIPPLENAPMIPGLEAEYLLDEEPVFGVVVNGDARAYPLRIIDNHEMANDVIGGVPVSIAYCTLCGAAIAYEGRGPTGEAITFGTSGFLYRSNKLMYDRPTRTLWNQLTGEPVLGELADTDIRLNILPIVLTSWAEWLVQHPDTLVLDRETGVYPGDFYEPGILYGEYFASDETMFPVWQRSNLLEAKDFVYALYLEGFPKAYDVRALAGEVVLNDTIGPTPVVLIAARDTVTVNGVHRRSGPVTYTNGGEVRAFDRGKEVFEPGIAPDSVVDSTGRSWQVTEEALVGPNGERAPRINGHLAYWFGWYAFFPDTELYPEP